MILLLLVSLPSTRSHPGKGIYLRGTLSIPYAFWAMQQESEKRLSRLFPTYTDIFGLPFQAHNRLPDVLCYSIVNEDASANSPPPSSWLVWMHQNLSIVLNSPKLSVRLLYFNNPPRPPWNAVVPDRSNSRLHRLLQS
jgi:hypothetical protein